MDILEQLGAKVKGAVQKIEELQARVAELEEINAKYEQKMQEMLDVMNPLDEAGSAAAPPESTSSGFGAPREERQDIYRQQY